MARAGHKPDAQTLQVVVGVAQGVDFQLATVARAGVHFTDGQCLTQNSQQFGVNGCRFSLRNRPDVGRGFGAASGASDLFDDLPDHRSCPE